MRGVHGPMQGSYRLALTGCSVCAAGTLLRLDSRQARRSGMRCIALLQNTHRGRAEYGGLVLPLARRGECASRRSLRLMAQSPVKSISES